MAPAASERGADVLHDRAFVEEPDGRGVEAEPLDGRVLREARHPELLPRGADARALSRVDAVERALERPGPARPHLDDRHDRPFTRDEVDLEAPHAQVAR